MIIYYPSDQWIKKSRFLHCNNTRLTTAETKILRNPSLTPPIIKYDDILFAATHTKFRSETEPLVAISADNYTLIFEHKVPLQRMLRRRIDKVEYVALSNAELVQLIQQNKSDNMNKYSAIRFVIPQLQMVRGYWLTKIKIIDLGKIQDISAIFNNQSNPNQIKNFKVEFEGRKPIELRASNQFIRWVGL